MNKKETAEAIKVMQAYVDGSEIELRVRHTDESWHHCDPVWHWQSYEYRVKSKARTFWVNTDNGTAILSDAGWEPTEKKISYIKVREVLTTEGD